MIEEFYGQDNVDEKDDTYTVRLDDFILRDDEGREQVIKGMYLKFDYWSENGKHYFDDLHGIRATQSNIEYSVGFFHPHLPANRVDRAEWRTFCMGNSAFRLHYEQCEHGVSEEEMYAFLMHLKYFLSYQDDTNPYIRLSSVLPLQEPKKYEYVNESDLSRLYKSELVKQLQFNTSLHLKDNYHNHKILMDIYPNVSQCVYVNGEIHRVLDNVEIIHEPTPLFDFKDGLVYSMTYEDELDIKLTEEDKRFNPSLFKIIDNEIHHRIKHKISQEAFKTIGTAEEIQIDNYRQLSESVKVSLFSYS